MRYIVDRLSEGIAVLESETGMRRKVEAAILPENVKEGDCLTEADGIFSLDAERTSARRKKLYARLKALVRKVGRAPGPKKK